MGRYLLHSMHNFNAVAVLLAYVVIVTCCVCTSMPTAECSSTPDVLKILLLVLLRRAT